MLLLIFQLTASRRGWRLAPVHSQPTANISTHSLTKRLTSSSFPIGATVCISTHSLTKRLTEPLIPAVPVLQIISTHSLTKRLTVHYIYRTSIKCISTHSLTKRLTMMYLIVTSEQEISTHSLTKRLTWQHTKNNISVIFQLTASRRGWPGIIFLPRKEVTFQLTASRRGWRRFDHRPFKTLDISTHSLTKRLTFQFCFSFFWKNISTHSLTKRLTYRNFHAFRCRLPFQLTASRRGWLLFLFHQIHSKRHFNSQPHEEADKLSPLDLSMKYKFQLTASRRGWRL